MLFLLALATLAYFAFLVWVRRSNRHDPYGYALPADDRPPASAVGWPPSGSAFEAYVNDGFAALDAYLSEGFAA